jgi:hypothetical protein
MSHLHFFNPGKAPFGPTPFSKEIYNEPVPKPQTENQAHSGGLFARDGVHHFTTVSIDIVFLDRTYIF